MNEKTCNEQVQIAKPVFVNDGNGLQKLNIDSIYYVESDGHYCNLYSNGGKRLCTLFYTVGALFDILDDYRFVRVSRSVFVNIWYVQRVRGTEIAMDDGKVLRIGKTYHGVIENHLLVLTGKRE